MLRTPNRKYSSAALRGARALRLSFALEGSAELSFALEDSAKKYSSAARRGARASRLSFALEGRAEVVEAHVEGDGLCVKNIRGASPLISSDQIRLAMRCRREAAAEGAGREGNEGEGEAHGEEGAGPVVREKDAARRVPRVVARAPGQLGGGGRDRECADCARGLAGIDEHPTEKHIDCQATV